MSSAERVEDRLADFTRDKRVLLLSLMALFIGAASSLVAKALVGRMYCCACSDGADVAPVDSDREDCTPRLSHNEGIQRRSTSGVAR